MLNSTTSSGKRTGILAIGTGILAIGAHPDDIELGCGASLSYYSNEKVYIISVVMTPGCYICCHDTWLLWRRVY